MLQDGFWSKKKVDLWIVQQWILANFKIKVSVPTVSRWKEALGLSFQLTSKRPMGSKMTHDDYVVGYFNFIMDLRASGFWDFDRSKILCFDSVTNSMRSDRDTTISLKGGVQKKLARNTPTHTNNYLVCVGLEGGLEFDVLMFTHDKTFDPNGESWPNVIKWCKKLGLRSDQIFYSKSTKKYCAEQASHISAFKDRYRKELKGTRVLHDGGPAYKINGQYILADGANRLVVLPSEQHGKLSPLDNWLNAIAKNLWRADRTNSNFSYDALILLKKLESVGQLDITKMWTHNFMLDAPKVTLTAVEEMLGEVRSKTPVRQVCADQYRDAYMSWSEMHTEIPLGQMSVELEQDLDGVYWK